ncbi:purine-nucleoside phosphorylase [Anaerococcus sp. Marseille-Q5996]|uniref:purine-nucleoside phosphorylase n=1 Tax=Anaerococcus sp. Marseille-Q5996 TaxID=2972769 RepID=UPI0021C5BB1F|nr:purine-nucleoside phosphorylase [Anaerococcus sp. Marseille-Q5996]
MNIPTPHISATSADQIAKTVLMPGDPLRAKFIAENFLDDVTQFTETRGMLGFTGYYKGKRVSVMGSGMGIPSSMIYYNELFGGYDVDTIIRVGTAGSMQEDIKLHDIVIATSACSESSINDNLFANINFSPTPDFDLMLETYNKSIELGYTTHCGQVHSSDQFYNELPEGVFENMKKYGVLCVEMESYGLFMAARKYGKKGLGIFTISDSLVENVADSAENREKSYTNMMTLALEVAHE